MSLAEICSSFDPAIVPHKMRLDHAIRGCVLTTPSHLGGAGLGLSILGMEGDRKEVVPMVESTIGVEALGRER